MSTSTREEIGIGPLTIRCLVEGEDSGGSVSIHEFDVPPGAGVAIRHSHDAYEETIYGVRGVLTFTLDGMPTDVGPGETLVIQRGVVHSFANTHEGPATALAIITPGILGAAYFREVAAVVDAAAGGPPDPAEIGAVMRRHGLTPAP